ncbi:MAG: hypothetical protein COX57_08840 [Alphaproteobacteria bacterium CG_4_10_14_0_2_um_filter_63_37]|nr:MAG: hypothetical protein AUJ55_06415 [Proteobacteria bacterium CG1_02_64_396]PJA24391.1 MAG: hypothetical protein COX57_08840 [Alphaproteobacteria bacterium CG_4_10_14_0_2_um_filter_63_37]
MSKITPFLWFDTQAEEAATFYTSVFKNSAINHVSRYGDNAPMPTGTAMTVAFQIDGQPFVALNGGPQYRFSPAISFVVDCADQAEIDHLWNTLAQGGQTQACGWLQDRYGVSWQIVPAALGRLLSGDDPERSSRVMQALWSMVKIDIAALERAFSGNE